MTPTGWNDPDRFAETVFLQSPIREPFAVSVSRLDAAVKTAAYALGVRAELTPQLVRYAYRHFKSLSFRQGEIIKTRRKPTPEEVVYKLQLTHETRKELEHIERRVRRRNARMEE